MIYTVSLWVALPLLSLAVVLSFVRLVLGPSLPDRVVALNVLPFQWGPFSSQSEMSITFIPAVDSVAVPVICVKLAFAYPPVGNVIAVLAPLYPKTQLRLPARLWGT